MNFLYYVKCMFHNELRKLVFSVQCFVLQIRAIKIKKIPKLNNMNFIKKIFLMTSKRKKIESSGRKVCLCKNPRKSLSGKRSLKSRLDLEC